MLRMHFSITDLARTRLAAGPVPIWETVLSLHRLQRGDGGALVGPWRRHARTAPPDGRRSLTALIPPSGYFPDFLTPATEADLPEVAEQVASTPRDVLRQDLAHLRSGHADTSFTKALWHGSATASKQLATALTGYHRATIAPIWHRIEEQVHTDRTRMAAGLAANGVAGMLALLPPALRWRPPVLEVDYPVDQDVVLGGRGLVLVPSFFCHRTAVTLLRDDDNPVLVYPVQHRSPDLRPDPAHAVALARLLGHSRAAVLESLDHSRTTSEVAEQAGVLVSSASQHLSALRAAHLVRTGRHGRSVRHTLTELGAAVLRGDPSGR
ncbi:Putative regulatory protein [Amycolatopsis japonica]|uniref:Putative regulatory protein n=2 Tax=Amycolatopsis japonica TaxID=208439 RepID=A0A075V1L2_9PSEU|nr:Putative regulatory protein [Amycolatopsis japonica]